jgi:hypothetical protein
VHFPPASNSIVLPDSGTCTGTLDALMNASVLLPGAHLAVPGADLVGVRGDHGRRLHELVDHVRRFAGPVVKPSPMFITASFAL